MDLDLHHLIRGIKYIINVVGSRLGCPNLACCPSSQSSCSQSGGGAAVLLWIFSSASL